MSLRNVYLFFSVIALVLGTARYYYQQGLTEATQICQAKEKKAAEDALQQFMDGSKQLTQAANEASKSLAIQVAARQQADEQTTKDIRNALRQTAHLRVGCEFDADIVQQLNTARERATHATTSGLGGSMPDTGGNGK